MLFIIVKLQVLLSTSFIVATLTIVSNSHMCHIIYSILKCFLPNLILILECFFFSLVFCFLTIRLCSLFCVCCGVSSDWVWFVCFFFTFFTIWWMLHAVSNVVSTLIACGMCVCFTIMAILGMLHDGTTACELWGVLTDVSWNCISVMLFIDFSSKLDFDTQFSNASSPVSSFSLHIFALKYLSENLSDIYLILKLMRHSTSDVASSSNLLLSHFSGYQNIDKLGKGRVQDQKWNWSFCLRQDY